MKSIVDLICNWADYAMKTINSIIKNIYKNYKIVVEDIDSLSIFRGSIR